jgi:hypothetical protein
MLRDDGQYWPKHVKAKFVFTPIKPITLDGYLLVNYVRLLCLLMLL